MSSWKEMKTEKEEAFELLDTGGENPLLCRIVRSNRKTYGIVIDENGQVFLRIPLRGSRATARKLAKEKQVWIREKVRLQKQRMQEKIALEEERSQKYTKEQREGLERRYRQAAKEYFPKRADYYAELLGVEYKKIRVAGQKTRWGSCSQSGTLSFNWKLMLAPPKVLDYVVVHELCHLLEMNHSSRFWKHVECIIPEYKEYRKWLREYGNTLQL